MRLVVFLIALMAVRAPVSANPTLNNAKHFNNVKKVQPVAVAATPVVTPAPTPSPAPSPPPVDLSDHDGLMSLAGISQSDWPAVDYIVSHESSWNPDATEPTSGAHGLVQALPYSKTECGWDDAVCQLEWGQQYATERYGGWWAAQAYWAAHRNW